MKNKNILIAVLGVLIIGIGGYFTLIKNHTFSQQRLPAVTVQSPETQSFAINGGNIIDIVLQIEAPFSTSSITVRNDNSASYRAKQRGQNEIQDSTTFTASQMNELAKIVEDIDFVNMKDQPMGNNDPLDGSSYTITINGLPNTGSSQLADAWVVSVNCYQFSCETNFLKLKDKIIKFWGKDVLEIGT